MKKAGMVICMYGAGSDKIDPVYVKQTEALGREIALAGCDMVYGGGAGGLMGACARGVSKAEGVVIGIIPKFMGRFEKINKKCTKIISTESMAARKQMMEAMADGFIIAPGGIGTFDEFFQILTLKELKRRTKPIVLYNIAGYYDDFLKVMESGVEKGFIRPGVMEMFYVCDDPREAVDYIRRKGAPRKVD